jgi:anti-sigma B factor antagonist
VACIEEGRAFHDTRPTAIAASRTTSATGPPTDVTEPERAWGSRYDRRSLSGDEGDIDLANCDQLRTAIEPELGPNITIVIDLSEVTYMDSTCLNVLLHAQLRQDELGGTFAIQHPSPTAERLLTLTGLEHLIRA